VTGTPIRTELQRLDRAEARARLGLNPDTLTLLVMGGSQGASGINQAVIRALPALQGLSLQVIHLSGGRDERLVADNYQRDGIRAFVAPFHHRMEEAYSAADFAVARSGAASLAELSFYALPSILIPFPYAADDHQTRNAEIFTKAGAALLVKEGDLAGDRLARTIRELGGNRETLAVMSEKCAALAPRDAAALVASTMEKYTNADRRI
jgi:UDP-N-acetylglucosamine--N-acetylmuramyl-(pentapeptide) pyrophosphoryl-undecaprenol N-acetylglucosamine transferase